MIKQNCVHSVTLKQSIKPALFTRKIGCGQGVSEMVAETYTCTLSKPLFKTTQSTGNFRRD